MGDWYVYIWTYTSNLKLSQQQFIVCHAGLRFVGSTDPFPTIGSTDPFPTIGLWSMTENELFSQEWCLCDLLTSRNPRCQILGRICKFLRIYFGAVLKMYFCSVALCYEINHAITSTRYHLSPEISQKKSVNSLLNISGLHISRILRCDTIPDMITFLLRNASPIVSTCVIDSSNSLWLVWYYAVTLYSYHPLAHY